MRRRLGIPGSLAVLTLCFLLFMLQLVGESLDNFISEVPLVWVTGWYIAGLLLLVLLFFFSSSMLDFKQDNNNLIAHHTFRDRIIDGALEYLQDVSAGLLVFFGPIVWISGLFILVIANFGAAVRISLLILGGLIVLGLIIRGLEYTDLIEAGSDEE